MSALYSRFPLPRSFLSVSLNRCSFSRFLLGHAPELYRIAQQNRRGKEIPRDMNLRLRTMIDEKMATGLSLGDAISSMMEDAKKTREN